MDKQVILDRVLAFCDVRGDTFNWRREPHRRELFQIFLDSHRGAARALTKSSLMCAAIWIQFADGTCRCRSA